MALLGGGGWLGWTLWTGRADASAGEPTTESARTTEIPALEQLHKTYGPQGLHVVGVSIDQGDQEQGIREFMQEFGDFFPNDPQSLDELLEQMAQQMAAMQSMLNSMTPAQREQLRQLSEQLLEDMDLRWQADQLGSHLRSLFPQMGWERRYDFSGTDPLDMAEAAELMERLGETEVVLDGIPNGFIHDGGRLEFGPDGHLYVSTGETGVARARI